MTDETISINEVRSLHVLANLRRSIDEAAGNDRMAMLEMISMAMSDYRRDSPLPVLTSFVSDSRWWASGAESLELEAYLVAISARLAETSMHTKTRKRLVAALFNGMSKQDRLAFAAWADKKNKEGEV